MLKKLLYFLLINLIPFQLWAQQTAQKFILETQYLLYLPDGYTSDTSTKWPLLIFLHGSGESGTELNKVESHGPPKLIEAGKKFPFIVVSPQAPPNTGWQIDVLKKLLENIKNKYRVDGDRVYMTGLSMGGFGTWDYAEKFANDLAAIAPICGGGDATKAWTLRYMPVWCFHGAKDNVVPPAASQTMVDSLRKFNKNVKFTLYPDANHNSWDVTYNNDSLYSWLLSQKKFSFAEVAVPVKTIQQYIGKYVGDNKDTITIIMEENKLFGKDVNNKIPLKASSPNNFYWRDNAIDEIWFNRDGKGTVTGFTIFRREKSIFRKLTN